MPPSPRTLTARWIIPMDQPPIENGILTIDGDCIASVSRNDRTPDSDLGNVAILPGFVNAHTHLDLTGLRGKCPPSNDFIGWVRQVVSHRRQASPEQVQADIASGLEESIRHGTTLLGDIASGGASWPVLSSAPIRSVVFREIIGLPEDRAQQSWQDIQQWLQEHPATEMCRPGVSPHAPYSVRSSLFSNVAGLDVPVAIHLAETPAELELLEHHSGPFVDFLQALDVWDADGLVASPEQVLAMYAGKSALFAHGNYLSADVIPADATIVYCPRTHAAFGHSPHPFREFIKRGIRVAVGTDSLASNPDLSVLAEIRFMHQQYPDVSGHDLLHMATLAGAEALGMADVTGSLTVGKSADLVVVPLPDEDGDDVYRMVLESQTNVSTMICNGIPLREPVS